MSRIERLYKSMDRDDSENWRIIRAQFAALDRDMQERLLNRWRVSDVPEDSYHFTACMSQVMFEGYS